MSTEFKKWLQERTWIQNCYDDDDNIVEGKKEYCLSVCLEPKAGQHYLESDEFWKEIALIKSMISEQGSYDAHAYPGGYQCDGFFDSFETMADSAKRLLRAFRDRLQWMICE